MTCWAMLLLGLLLAPFLRADGDTGALLATPERLKGGELVPNAASSTIRLGSESDPLTGKRDGWSALNGAFCYARATGVGLRAEGQSVLWRPFEEPETVSTVTVVCGAESNGSRGEPLALTLSLGDREIATQTFTIEEAGEARTVTFTFPATEATDLRLSNAGEKVFEVQRVSWYADLPPIEATIAVGGATVGDILTCSVSACTGGSGEYVRALWTFNGLSSAPVTDLQTVVSFPCPARDGTYELTLEVVDTLGNSRTFTRDVRVYGFTPPAPTVSAVTRTGFTLTWDRPASGVTPEAFSVSVSRSGRLDVTLTPGWIRSGKAWLTPPLTLDDALDGLDADLILLTIPADWQGALKVLVGDAPAWRTLFNVTPGLFSGFSLSPGQTFRLRAEGDAPPDALAFTAATGRTFWKREVPADGHRAEATVDGLPPGATVRVAVSARFRDADGILIAGDCPSFDVELLPIPRPVAALDGAGRIHFDWDALGLAPGETLALSLSLFAEVPAQAALPPGLYLTRILLTQSKAAKAIALTNTSPADIPLDGAYTLTYGKYDWDFYVKDAAGKDVHSLVVPAHGDLVIVSNQYRPADLREDVAFGTANALRYMKDAGPVTLLRDGAPVNALLPVMDAVVRLPADSLSGAAATPAAQDDPALDALYDPWPQPTPVTERLYARTLAPGTDTFTPGPYLSKRPAAATRVWAELRTLLDGGASEPLLIDLWARETLSAPKPGFRLRLR